MTERLKTNLYTGPDDKRRRAREWRLHLPVDLRIQVERECRRLDEEADAEALREQKPPRRHSPSQWVADAIRQRLRRDRDMLDAGAEPPQGPPRHDAARHGHMRTAKWPLTIPLDLRLAVERECRRLDALADADARRTGMRPVRYYPSAWVAEAIRQRFAREGEPEQNP